MACSPLLDRGMLTDVGGGGGGIMPPALLDTGRAYLQNQGSQDGNEFTVLKINPSS